MNNSKNQLQEAFNGLYNLSIQEKVLFLESLLFSFTISVRAIWSDEQLPDKDKVEAFKWLNELNHRIWNIISELKEGVDTDSITRVYENLKFYSNQSALLTMHLAPTLLSAFERFKNINNSF